MIATADNVTFIPATKVIGVRTEPEAKPRLRVAAYCRVSTDRDEQESSFDAQVDHYTKYINGNSDWIFAGIYADEGISGMNTRKREQFNRMIEDCIDGKIDMVVTKSVSRFARNTIDCLEYVRKLKASNVAVLFEKENINTLDTKGEMFLTLMASLAQQESESLGRNVTMGFQFRYQQGKVLVNYNRFLGFTKRDGKLVVDEEGARTVRRIFLEYLSGSSCKRIAKGLEADGVRNGAGNTKWWDSNITQILTNEKYMGDALLQKTFTADPLEKKRLPNRGERPQYYVEACLEPIVSKEVFLQVQDEMARRSSMLTEEGGRLHRSYNALSGLVFCSECGKPYRRVHWNNRGCRSVVWRCRTRLSSGKEQCCSRTASEDEIKAAVLEAVNGLFADRESLVPVLRQNMSQMLVDTTDERAKVIDDELSRLQKQMIGNPGMEDALGQRIVALRRKKDELYAEHARNDAMRMKVDRLLSLLDGSGIDEYSEDLVRSFIKRIDVRQDGFRITFRTGVEVEVS